MRDNPGAPCPKCGAAAARQFFPAGIVFKGSGFYKTDSRGAASSSITSDGGELEERREQHEDGHRKVRKQNPCIRSFIVHNQETGFD